MTYFNQILTSVLPVFPRSFIRPIAMRYVAGESKRSAIKAVKYLNNKGYSATLDILGEHTDSYEKARFIRDAYLDLYDTIQREQVDCNVSIKLTHLGMEFDNILMEKTVTEIVQHAEKLNNFTRIDMENSPYTTKTLKIYQKLRKRHHSVGIVLQSYLYRSQDDLKRLMNGKLNVRVCKGIYNEPPEIAYRDRKKIRDNFIDLVQNVLRGEGYAAIATHDRMIIDTLETWITNKKIPDKRFEFQVLYGVPMGGKLQKLLDKGYKVRVYVPFGEEWYDYSLRRLKENPHLTRYIVKNLFKQK